MRKRFALVALAAAAGLGFALAGCMDSALRVPSGFEGGATPGGAQDIGLARDKIANNQIPAAGDFTVEGILSEHDLPIEGEPCARTLCVRAAVGVAKNIDTGEREAFVQIGFSSNVNTEEFRRGPLNLAAVVDVSGSMAGDKIAAVRDALAKLVDRLDERDLFTLVEFDDSARLRWGPSPVTDRDELKRIVAGMRDMGGTCIECGLRLGYEKVEQRHSGERSSRVILFTDAMPNVGATGEGEFTDLVRAKADHVGLTAFGVGLDFGHGLALAISRIRGGNYFFLEDAEKTRKVFDEEFDMLVTPLAYDLELRLTPGTGFKVEAVHGIPTWKAGDTEATIEVATVFLSKRRGAILARMSPGSGGVQPQQPIYNAFLGYTEVAGGSPTATLETAYDGAEPLAEEATWFSKQGVRKTVALTNFILGAQKACRLWAEGTRDEARAAAEATRAYLASEADAMDDDGLRAEAELAGKLAALMQ
jgi:Ca-activated chloride channel family protein